MSLSGDHTRKQEENPKDLSYLASTETEITPSDASASSTTKLWFLDDILDEMINKTDNQPNQFQQQHDWTITKTLTKTDVTFSAAQLRLNKKSVEEHILKHLSIDDQVKIGKGEPVKVNVHDCNTESEHKLRLEYKQGYFLRADWENKGEWVKDFIIRRKLKEGDEIGFFWDASASTLCFSLLSNPTGNPPAEE